MGSNKYGVKSRKSIKKSNTYYIKKGVRCKNIIKYWAIPLKIYMFVAKK